VDVSSIFRKKSVFQVTPEHAKTQELIHEDCLAANYTSTGPQQQNTDDHNCPVDIVERLSTADWRTTDVDDCTKFNCTKLSNLKHYKNHQFRWKIKQKQAKLCL